MSFLKHDIRRDACMLSGSFARRGYDWWWHSFTAKKQTTGEEVPFFIEFFLINPALGDSKPHFGQHPTNPEHPSYLMIKAGCWGENKCQLHRFFPWTQVSVKSGVPYEVQAQDCLASENRLKGKLCVSESDAAEHPEYMSDAGEMTFDLTLKKVIPFNVGYGASTPLRKMQAFEMYWHAEGMKTEYSGTITLNGEVYQVFPESSFGYADKNWGSNFTSPWVWLASSCLTSERTGKRLENSVFDIGGGCPRIFGIPLKRKLLGALCYEGVPYEFNFSKFWTLTRTQFSFEEEENVVRWHVTQTNLNSRISVEITCQKKDMLFVNYESPDGKKRYTRLFNGGNGQGTIELFRKNGHQWIPIDRMYADHIGCEYGEYDQ